MSAVKTLDVNISYKRTPAFSFFSNKNVIAVSLIWISSILGVVENQSHIVLFLISLQVDSSWSWHFLVLSAVCYEMSRQIQVGMFTSAPDVCLTWHLRSTWKLLCNNGSNLIMDVIVYHLSENIFITAGKTPQQNGHTIVACISHRIQLRAHLKASM